MHYLPLDVHHCGRGWCPCSCRIACCKACPLNGAAAANASPSSDPALRQAQHSAQERLRVAIPQLLFHSQQLVGMRLLYVHLFVYFHALRLPPLSTKFGLRLIGVRHLRATGGQFRKKGKISAPQLPPLQRPHAFPKIIPTHFQRASRRYHLVILSLHIMSTTAHNAPRPLRLHFRYPSKLLATINAGKLGVAPRIVVFIHPPHQKLLITTIFLLKRTTPYSGRNNHNLRDDSKLIFYVAIQQN